MVSKNNNDLLATFEKQLQELQDEIKAIAIDLSAPDSPDFADRATENEGDEVLEERGKVAQLEVEQIEAAITRIKLGTYGVCTHCGQPIRTARLVALPYAAHCIACATRDEEATVST